MLDGLLNAAPASTVPSRPLLKPWYRLAENDDGILLEYAGSVVALGGRATQHLLPVLLPLLDGTRTLDDLVAVTGRAAAPAVENALAVLSRHGLLLEGPRLASHDLRRASAEFLVSRSGKPTSEVAALLESTVVCLVGRPDLTDAVARLLRLSGVAARRGEALDADLTIAAALDPDELDALNRATQRDGRVWIPIGDFDGHVAEIGPLVVPAETACAECVRIRRRSTSGCATEQAVLRGSPQATVLPPTLVALVAALAAHDIVRWVGSRDPGIPGILTIVETTPAPVLSQRTVLRVPRCPVCSPASSRAAPAPWYEAAGGPSE